LDSPFNQEFDRTQWWKDETDINPVAALYELARRHPLVGDLRKKFRSTSMGKNCALGALVLRKIV